jgi:hypothetical protein
MDDITNVRKLPNSATFCFVRIKKHLPEEQKNPVYYPDGVSMAQRDAEYAPQRATIDRSLSSARQLPVRATLDAHILTLLIVFVLFEISSVPDDAPL